MTVVDTSRSEEMLERRRALLPAGVTGAGRWEDPYPIVFVRARGQYIEDVDGTEYLDYHGGYGTAILGYSHPGVDGAVARAMADGQTFVGCAQIHEAALAERLVALLPEADRIAFCGGGGSDPLYHAARLARAATGRRKIVKVEGGYQGWHADFGASTVPPAGDTAPTHEPPTVPNSAGVLPEVTAAILAVTANDISSLEARFAAEGDDIAAVFVEPALYSSGVIPIEPAYLRAARELCDRHGAVLVFDEVICGFRSRVGGAAVPSGVVPDLAAYGKAIANGHVFALLAGRAALMDQLAPAGDVFFSGTFNGAALGVAAASAVLDELQTTDAMDRAVRASQRLAVGVNAAIASRGLNAVVQQHGSAWNLYFHTRKVRDARDLAASLAHDTEALNLALRHHLRDHAIFLQRRAGTLRGFVSAQHTDADIDRTIEAIEGFLALHEGTLAR